MSGQKRILSGFTSSYWTYAFWAGLLITPVLLIFHPRINQALLGGLKALLVVLATDVGIYGVAGALFLTMVYFYFVR